MSSAQTPYFFRTPGGGSGSGTGTGAKNYISNSNFETNLTTSWSLAHSTIASSLPTTVATATNAFSSAGGVHGGSAASVNLSFTTISSGKLAGSFSGSYASSAASTQGDMLISDAFSIDIEDQAKVMTIKFYYQVQSGASNANWSGTSSNSFAVFIYDVTNGAWIQPAGVYNLIQSSGVGYMTGTFQTTSNSTSYQLAIINLNATSGAATLYVDDIFVGPQTAPLGPAMTDYISWTPTGAWSTNTTYTGWFKRTGDSLSMIVKIALAGAPTSASLTVTLPNSYVIDTTKLPGTPSNQVLGLVTGQGAAHTFSGIALYNTTTSIGIFYTLDGSTASIMSYAAVTQAAPYVFANADFIYIQVDNIPISGWSSNVIMSNDTDTRVVAMVAQQSAPTATVTSTPSLLKFTSAPIQDTHGGFSTSTGLYTVPVSGFYRATAAVTTSGTFAANNTAAISIAKNGTEVQRAIQIASGSISNLASYISVTALYNAGDTISPLVSSGAGTPTITSSATNNFFMIERLTGPAIIAATESVGAAFSDVSGVTLTTAYVTYAYANKIFDTHSAFGSSGYYVTPVSGKYELSAAFATQPSNIAGSTWGINIAAFCGVTQFAGGWAPGTGASMTMFASCDGQINCTAGQTLYIQIKAAAATIGYTGFGFNTLNIKRVGY